jgi:hypothetical protein
MRIQTAPKLTHSEVLREIISSWGIDPKEFLNNRTLAQISVSEVDANTLTLKTRKISAHKWSLILF